MSIQKLIFLFSSFTWQIVVLTQQPENNFIPTGLLQQYTISPNQKNNIIVGYLNNDIHPDTVLILQEKRTRKNALLIKHGNTSSYLLFKTGKELGQSFSDFNWANTFVLVKKGKQVWNNVRNGEIVSKDQVDKSRIITLKTDAIYLHENEGGGGIIYFKDGKYVWIQQD